MDHTPAPNVEYDPASDSHTPVTLAPIDTEDAISPRVDVTGRLDFPT